VTDRLNTRIRGKKKTLTDNITSSYKKLQLIKQNVSKMQMHLWLHLPLSQYTFLPPDHTFWYGYMARTSGNIDSGKSVLSIAGLPMSRIANFLGQLSGPNVDTEGDLLTPIVSCSRM